LFACLPEHAFEHVLVHLKKYGLFITSGDARTLDGNDSRFEGKPVTAFWSGAGEDFLLAGNTSLLAGGVSLLAGDNVRLDFFCLLMPFLFLQTDFKVIVELLHHIANRRRRLFYFSIDSPTSG
jgi:hypothetical protein